jgi:hypothetical protein
MLSPRYFKWRILVVAFSGAPGIKEFKKLCDGRNIL